MTQPSHPHYEPISVIEDLDPEDGGGRGGGVRFDLLLGIPLLLCVMVFVGWQWWHRSYQSDQMYAARQAEGQGDLDAALYYFGEASGYEDADAQGERIRADIAERDRLYESAVDLAAKEQWLPALHDIRGVAKLQAEYKNTLALERMLEDKAIGHIYTDALSGTVILKESGNPPGLYYRNTAGWVWLKGSDARSKLFGITSEGYIVFDAPGPEPPPTPTPTPPRGLGERYSYYSGRCFVVAHLADGGLEYTDMPLDAVTFVPTVVGKNGYWALNYNSSMLDGTSDQSRYINPVVDEPFHDSNMAYQPYSGANAAYIGLRVTEDVATGSAFVAVNPDSNRYLVAEWSDASASGPSADTVINLYLCEAGTSFNRLVYTYRGGSIQSAMISPNDRYILITAYKEVDEAGERSDQVTTSLIDVEGDSEPKILKEVMDNRNPDRKPQGGIEATFVNTGGFAGKIVLAQYSPENTDIWLIDPEKVYDNASPIYVIKQADLLGDIDVQWRIREQNDTGIAVTAETYTGPTYGVSKGTYTLHVIVFPVDGPLETYRIRSGSTGEISIMRTTGNYIRWIDSDYTDGRGSGTPLTTRSVFSVDRIGEEGNEPSPRLEVSTGALGRQGFQTSDSVNLGEDLMVYIVDGELHAHTYSGDIDILLETGVSAIFENHIYDPGWLR